MKPIVVNLFGGPGAGKSTTAASVFGLLKLHNVNSELITEFAKDLTWENRGKTLENQYYVWAKQHHRIWRVVSQVDVVITDAPLLHSLVYGTTSSAFKETVLQSIAEFHNVNYYIQRKKIYNPAGRGQTEEEAQELDTVIRDALCNYDVTVTEVPGSVKGINIITHDILGLLNKKMECEIQWRQ